jgi:glutamate-1-semialdehyde 2,1-aminomutase
LTGNPVACAAGLATLEVLRQPGAYERLSALGEQLARGLRQVGADAGVPLQVLGDAPILQTYFTMQEPLCNYRDLLRDNRGKVVRFGHELIRHGLYCTPGGKLYLSLAHTDAEIDRSLKIAAEALKAVK